MSGVMFVIRVPTEAEERRMSGVHDNAPKLIVSTNAIDIIVTPVQTDSDSLIPATSLVDLSCNQVCLKSVHY